MSKLMEKDVHNAAVEGDLNILRNKNEEQLLKKTYQNNNIIHIAAQHKRFDFIKAALNRFPSIPTCESLICEENCKGNTPLHIAAEVGDESVIDHLCVFFLTQCGSNRVFPWRMVNSKGNTPAHIALLFGNGSVAMYLVEKDDSLALVTNDSKETLLHLAIQYHVSDDPKTEATSSCNENVLPIIELLLKIESSLACWANTDGLTALHLAASLDPVYCIPVIKTMLASCPEAAAVRDERSEQTILHLLTNHKVASYEQGIELMQIPEVNALLNSKDDQGDTPFHLAARNCDRIMVRVLLEFSPKLDLKNKCGVSVRSLLRQLEEMRARRKLTEEEYEAARKGNAAFLNQQLESLGMDFLASHTPTEGNILHVLMQSESYEDVDKATEFIKQAIKILPSLISQQDRNGNTLLHLSLQGLKGTSSELINPDDLMIAERGAFDHDDDGPHSSLYRLKNVKGDTPLHVAIRVHNYDFAIQLLKVDSEVAGYVNNRNQTPLHLLPPVITEYRETLDELIRCLVNGNADIPYMQDEDGLTPLLIAVRESNFEAVKTLYKQFPASGKIADFKGRTFWHWFGYRHVGECDSSLDKLIAGLIRKTWDFLIRRTSDDYLRRQDNDGNTPLHIAIANKQFILAKRFVKCGTTDFMEGLLAIENKEGVSCYDLIGSAEHLPFQFEKFLSRRTTFISGHRSMYSIPTTKIEAYTNTIGVIAALLATISFTAAFTVPGGLDSSNGTPLLLGNAMFQVFLVADVVAMISSVTVLFCLLWIMTTWNKKDSILLLDVSVFLLQTSFYATLMTFMAGLYVTTISMVPAIAISTCVICNLLIILLNKRLVMWTIVPFFGALITWVPIIFGHTYSCIREWYIRKMLIAGLLRFE